MRKQYFPCLCFPQGQNSLEVVAVAQMSTKKKIRKGEKKNPMCSLVEQNPINKTRKFLAPLALDVFKQLGSL